jgi:hypothetical protein
VSLGKHDNTRALVLDNAQKHYPRLLRHQVGGSTCIGSKAMQYGGGSSNALLNYGSIAAAEEAAAQAQAEHILVHDMRREQQQQQQQQPRPCPCLSSEFYGVGACGKQRNGKKDQKELGGSQWATRHTDTLTQQWAVGEGGGRGDDGPWHGIYL